MTIYDNYASANGTSSLSEECNYNTLPPSAPEEQVLPDHAPAGAASLPHSTGTFAKDDVSDLTNINNAALHQTLNHESRIPYHKEAAMKGDGALEIDGPPAALGGPASVYCSGFASDPSKKRPLSISSTSSTTSSTSSLPRPQRKKVAGVGGNGGYGSPLVPNGHLSTNVVDYVTGSGALMNAGSGAAMSSSVSAVSGLSDSIVVDMQVSMEADDGEDFSKIDDGENAKLSRTEASRQDSATSSSSVSYIDKVVAEILETERTYVHDLNQIIQGYLCELRKDAESPLGSTDIGALFGNIEEIYEFNKVFLEELESCQEDAVRLAQCFVDQNEGFVIYSDYCTNYPVSVEVLTTVMDCPEKAAVIRQQQARLEHNLPLGAYLLKPVQRILKYHLLLQNMLSHIEEGGSDVVSAALSSMTNMAAHINEMKRKHEHAVRQQEMQSLLYDWDGADLSTYGELVLEETFRMHGAKGDRHLLLFQKGLVIAKHKDDAGLQIKDCIKCSNLMLVESIPREPLSFHVIPFDNPRGQYTFQARSLDQKRQWCLELKRLILESYTADKAIPSSVKDLVLTLTSRDERSAREQGGLQQAAPGTPKPCPAPDYLERKRRPRRRSVTSVLPDFAHLKSQVTKKVLPKRGDGVSPKVSPHVRRRVSESSLPRNSATFLIEKQKKQGLCDVEDLSVAECAEPGVFRSLESLHSPTSKSSIGAKSKQNCNRLSTDTDERLSLTEETWDEESGQESVESTPTTSPAVLHWVDSDQNSLNSASPSPLKRRESFRIATMLHPVETRKPPNCRKQHNRAFSSGEPQISKERKVPRPLRTCRRVSEGDLQYISKNPELNPPDIDNGYVTVTAPPPIALSPEEDGDDEAEEEPLYSIIHNPQIGVRLVEDEEGDFSELSLHSSLNPGDANNNPTSNQTSLEMTNEQSDNSESYRQLQPVTRQGHLLTKGLRSGLRSQRSQSCSPCLRVPPDQNSLKVGRSAGHEQSTSPNESNLNNSSADQIGLYDNVEYHWDTGQDTSSLQSYLNSNLTPKSISVMSGQEKTGKSKKSNPWVLQLESPDVENSHESSRNLRSNSLTSLSDLTQDVHSRYDHRRLPSDTLVFLNRNAYVTAGISGAIQHDIDTERVIARLATPPRELGPQDVIQQIKDCQERGRIVNRYATPPRTLSDSISLGSTSTVIANSYSDESEACGVVSPTGSNGPYNLRPRSHSTLPNDMRHAGPDMWNDFEDYITKSPSANSPVVPRFPMNGGTSPNKNHYRQSSLSETNSQHLVSQSCTNSIQRPTFSSPSSVTSSESIVDSLKQAVFSFTSRIASHLPRSTESSPRRAPRSRSISALEELKVERLQEPQKPTLRKKDKRGRFVAQLAKVYSEHMKKKGRTASVERSSLERSGSFKEKGSSKLTKQLNTLLREHKPGSSVIGERMASSKPVVLGTYTLPRHRPPRPKKSSRKSKTESHIEPETEEEENPETVVRRRSQSQKLEGDSCHSSAYDSGCIDVGVKDLTLEGDRQGEDALKATLEAFNSVYTGMDSDDEESSIYYYERKFVEDLESNFGDDAFRDSAVYSDDGCTLTDPDTASLNVSIRDTMKLIEQRSQMRAVQRTEIRQEEKAKGIKDILKSLEMAAQARLESVRQDRPLDSEAVASEKAMLKSIRDRTRELVECATLTRIRQTACSVLEDMPSGDDDLTVEGAAGSASPPLRRGWVKQVVTLLQEHPEQLLSSSED